MAALGAIVALVGCLLPWYRLGGEGGLTPITYGAFDGAGLLTFLAALAVLALVALPYAAGDRPVGIDRGIAYGLLAALSLAGVALWVPQVLADLAGLTPDRAPGWWIAAVGSIVLGRGAFEVVLEPPRR